MNCVIEDGGGELTIAFLESTNLAQYDGCPVILWSKRSSSPEINWEIFS